MIFMQINGEIIMTDAEHLTLINPLELIYKDKSWQHISHKAENENSFNNQAKNLLEYEKYLNKFPKRINNTFKFSKKQSYMTTEATLSKKNQGSKKQTARLGNKSAVDNLINGLEINRNFDKTASKKGIKNASIAQNSNLASNSLDLFNECRKMNFSNKQIIINNGPITGSSYTCLNCLDIKNQLDCKTFEETELSELVNLLCCECNPITE